jgi:hypothetical protein
MQEFIDQSIQVLRDGFTQINDPKGLLIALAATVFLGSWRQWVPVALVATVVHIIIERLAPVLAGGGGEVTLPPLMEESFWTRTGVLFVGYLIVIAVFFFVKRMLTGGKAKH